MAVVIGLYYFFDYRNRSSEPSSQESQASEADSLASAILFQPMDNKNLEATESKIETLKEGSGPGAKASDTVTVHYTGTLTNGQKFDSSLDRGQPFSFQLGAGQVIQGWDQGLVGMKVGEKRRLFIPSTLGYGAQGAEGVIPPNATLIFEVEMLKIE